LPFLSANGRIALTPLDIVGGNKRLVKRLAVLEEQSYFVGSARDIMGSSNLAVINALVPSQPGRYDLTPIGLVSFGFGPRGAMDYEFYNRKTINEIENFFIDHRFQNAGYGNDAVATAVRYLCKLITNITNPSYAICLTVHPDNEKAKQLYKANGFQIIREDGEDLTDMVLYDPFNVQPNVFDANELMPEEHMPISAIEDAAAAQSISCEICMKRIDQCGIAVKINRADPTATATTRAGVCSRACFSKLN